MSKIIKIPTFKDKTGKLSVVEKIIGFKIKRIFYIYDIKNVRGGHKHKKCVQFLICLKGVCKLIVKNKKKGINKEYLLKRPDQGILINPDDWHQMHATKKNTFLLVLASKYFDKKDYIYNE